MSFVPIGAFGWKLYHDKQLVYELTLPAGTKTGNYYVFGVAIAEVVCPQNSRLRIRAIETQGADENMCKVQANEALLASVQNDTESDREKPDFLTANSDVIGWSLSLLTILISWLLQLRSRFLQKTIKLIILILLF